MKTTCHDIQLALTAGEGLPPEGIEHLAECHNCRAFADLQARALATVDGSEPPAAVDRAILAFARSQAQVAATRPPRWRLVPKLISYAAAAAIAVCLGMLAWRLGQSAPPGTEAPHRIVAGDPTSNEAPPPTLVAGSGSELLDWNYTQLDASLLKIETELALLDSAGKSLDTLESTL